MGEEEQIAPIGRIRKKVVTGKKKTTERRNLPQNYSK